MGRFDVLFVAALALIVSGCASSNADPNSRLEDRYRTSQPSNSSVLFPGEHRGLHVSEAPLWLLLER